MTATRSAIWETTAKSWEMKSMDEIVGAADVFQKIEDLGLNGYVEGGGGFVGDEELGAVDEGHGDEDALTLAAGELVGVVVEAALGEGNLLHCGYDPCFEGVAWLFRVVGQIGFGDLGADLHDWVEGGHGFLEDHGDGAASVVAHLFFGDG